MRRYNRYTRMNGQPNFFHFRVITARFDSTCKCGANVVAGSSVAWAKNRPAICMQCYREWEFQVQREEAICNYNEQLMGGAW